MCQTNVILALFLVAEVDFPAPWPETSLVRKACSTGHRQRVQEIAGFEMQEKEREGAADGKPTGGRPCYLLSDYRKDSLDQLVGSKQQGTATALWGRRPSLQRSPQQDSESLNCVVGQGWWQCGDVGSLGVGPVWEGAQLEDGLCPGVHGQAEQQDTHQVHQEARPHLQWSNK